MGRLGGRERELDCCQVAIGSQRRQPPLAFGGMEARAWPDRSVFWGRARSEGKTAPDGGEAISQSIRRKLAPLCTGNGPGGRPTDSFFNHFIFQAESLINNNNRTPAHLARAQRQTQESHFTARSLTGAELASGGRQLRTPPSCWLQPLDSDSAPRAAGVIRLPLFSLGLSPKRLANMLQRDTQKRRGGARRPRRLKQKPVPPLGRRRAWQENKKANESQRAIKQGDG